MCVFGTDRLWSVFMENVLVVLPTRTGECGIFLLSGEPDNKRFKPYTWN